MRVCLWCACVRVCVCPVYALLIIDGRFAQEGGCANGIGWTWNVNCICMGKATRGFVPVNAHNPMVVACGAVCGCPAAVDKETATVLPSFELTILEVVGFFPLQRVGPQRLLTIHYVTKETSTLS